VRLLIKKLCGTLLNPQVLAEAPFGLICFLRIAQETLIVPLGVDGIPRLLRRVTFFHCART
jgi:hypothetical protein